MSFTLNRRRFGALLGAGALAGAMPLRPPGAGGRDHLILALTFDCRTPSALAA